MNWKISITVAALVFAAVSFAQPGGGGQGGGRGQGGGFMRGGRGGGGMMGLVRRPDVQAELKLSNEQKDAINALAPQRGGGGAGGGGGRGQGGGGGAAGGGQPGQGFDREAMLKRQQEQEAKLNEILNDDQEKRLKELVVQREGFRVALNPTFGKDLGITEEQKKQFDALQQKQMEAQRQMMERMRNQEITREEAQEAGRNNDKIMQTELGKILTDAQRAKIESWKGAPFKFEDGN